MKTIRLSLLAIGVAAATLSFVAPEPAATTGVSASAAAGQISWKSEVVNVGEIPQGTPHSIQFEFTNTTDKPVVITKVKAQCGCTATEYSKEAVAPKKTGFVTAKYDARSAGAFTKTVTVYTSDSETPKTLTFKGTVIAKN